MSVQSARRRRRLHDALSGVIFGLFMAFVLTRWCGAVAANDTRLDALASCADERTQHDGTVSWRIAFEACEAEGK